MEVSGGNGEGSSSFHVGSGQVAEASEEFNLIHTEQEQECSMQMRKGERLT